MLAFHLQNIINQLDVINDGTFSILIIGDRGTGKSKLLERLSQDSISEYDKIESELKKDKYNNDEQKTPFVIDLVEDFLYEEQKKIFKLIETGKNNVLKNIEGEKKCPQLIFTSQLELSSLYENSRFYKPFIDRISHQVFKLPSLRKLSKEEITSCWESVNKLMLYSDEKYLNMIKTYEKIIIDFIKIELFLYGNFRDLEKLSIFLWRLAKDQESNNVFSKDFLQNKLIEYKKINEVEIQSEFFKTNQNADSMIKEFRKTLVDWAEKKYNDLSRTELINKLEISEKTYYNWKNGM